MCKKRVCCEITIKWRPLIVSYCWSYNSTVAFAENVDGYKADILYQAVGLISPFFTLYMLNFSEET